MVESQGKPQPKAMDVYVEPPKVEKVDSTAPEINRLDPEIQGLL